MSESARFLGGTGGKIGLNVEKWSFSEGLMGLLGLCFKFYYAPLSGHYGNYIMENFVFKTYAYPKLSRKNDRGG